MPRFTAADLQAHLLTACVPGADDAVERIAVYLAGVREDLESAEADLDAYRSRTATSDIEDAAMLLGEALGFGYGYRMAPGEGHHWRALRLLTIHCHVNHPALVPAAAQLELLRIYRNRVKYEGMEATAGQTRLYFEAVRRIHDTVRDDPLRILQSRRS